MNVQHVYHQYRDEEKIFYRDGKETKDYAINELVKDYYFDENGFLAVILYDSKPDKTKPYVLYKELGDYQLTDRHNYYCRYRDDNRVTSLATFESVEEIYSYLERWCNIKRELILDLTEE